MPAPDLPPPPTFGEVDRPVRVHLHSRWMSGVEGGIVVVVDQLRASVTMAAALGAGARAVVPTLTVEEARAEADRRRSAGEAVVLGGERGGVRIEGFDLDNSPRSYAAERVAGKVVVFTTSNGTAALLAARDGGAARVCVGSLANLSAVCGAVAEERRAVHVVCCGTRDEVSLDDVMGAGALVERLVEMGRGLEGEDSGRVALMAWRGARAMGVEAALRESRGGRNLAKQGLGEDVAWCARVDSVGVVPWFDGREVRR